MTPSQTWMNPDFLLASPRAAALYHEYVEPLPVVDICAFLSPAELAADSGWANPGDFWLKPDPEKSALLTGGKEPDFSVKAFSAHIPRLAGSPLLASSQLELTRLFGVMRQLTPGTAPQINAILTERLADPAFTARCLLRRFNVETLCIPMDPCEDLKHFTSLKQTATGWVIPTFRPDAAFEIEDLKGWNAWIDRLEKCSRRTVRTYEDLLAALERRMAVFAAQGCVINDCRMALFGMPRTPPDHVSLDSVIRKIRNARQPASADEVTAFRSELLHDLGVMASKAHWVSHIRFGRLRGLALLRAHTLRAPAMENVTGSENALSVALLSMLQRQNAAGTLPQTLISPIDPEDALSAASVIDAISPFVPAGRVTLGTPGSMGRIPGLLASQLDLLGLLHALTEWVGAPSCATSFAHLTRHELFRRRLCAEFAARMTAGSLPDDLPWMGSILRDICCENPRRLITGQTE